MKFCNLIQDLISSLWIQTSRRLIQNQDLRIHCQNSGNRNTLFLSSGQIKWRFFEIFFFEPNLKKCFLRLFFRFFSALSLIHRSKADIRKHVTFKKLMLRILKHQTDFTSKCASIIVLCPYIFTIVGYCS